jgi:hypothetical protein
MADTAGGGAEPAEAVEEPRWEASATSGRASWATTSDALVSRESPLIDAVDAVSRWLMVSSAAVLAKYIYRICIPYSAERVKSYFLLV